MSGIIVVVEIGGRTSIPTDMPHFVLYSVFYIDYLDFLFATLSSCDLYVPKADMAPTLS